jgi:hypothetical protein
MKKQIALLAVVLGVAAAVTFYAESGPVNYYGNPSSPDIYGNTVLGAIWQAGSTVQTNVILGNGTHILLTTGSNNIYISAAGNATDNGQIRLGTAGVQSNCVVAGGLIIAANGVNVPTFSINTNTATQVISSTGTGITVLPGSTDTSWTEIITNGSLHAWTNTYGFPLQTNNFLVARTGTNYTVRVTGFQFAGSAINPFTYCPPDTFVASNLTTTSYILVATGTGTALPSSAVLGIQGTVIGQ